MELNTDRWLDYIVYHHPAIPEEERWKNCSRLRAFLFESFIATVYTHTYPLPTPTPQFQPHTQSYCFWSLHRFYRITS